jgi:hypothetical protein
MSTKYPFINEQCESLWNSKLPVLKEMKNMAKKNHIDVHIATGKDFHRLILGNFCITPKCTECKATSDNCKHKAIR